MLLSERVAIKWYSRNKNWYESKGYEFTKVGDPFEVDVSDLPKSSHTEIVLLCDYCLDIKIKRKYNEYIRIKNKDIVHKDCCKKCKQIKTRESNIKKYNVENAFMLDSTIENNIKNKTMKFNMVKKAFEDNGFTLLINESNYIKSTDKMMCICNKHPDKIVYKKYTHIIRGQGCYKCKKEKLGGRNHYNWNGGITTLNNFLRESVADWKRDSLRKYNYRCAISNRPFEVIHHLHNFSKIVKETLLELNMPIHHDIGKYSDDELIKISKKCKELHYEYGLGIPLTNEIHKEFHRIYGSKNNTEEQFKEFILNKKERSVVKCI